MELPLFNTIITIWHPLSDVAYPLMLQEGLIRKFIHMGGEKWFENAFNAFAPKNNSYMPSKN